MAVKVTVDLSNKLIIVNNGITSLDAEVDLYSDLKEDWVTNASGELGFEFPFRTVGGDPLPGGLEAGAFFFLRNDLGWRIRPYEGDHELIIMGNLYPEAIAYPMAVPTLGGYTVSISWERSSLTQQTAPQDADIDAIKAKTDNLPATPADESSLQDLRDKVGVPTSTVASDLDSIAERTQNLPDDPADQSEIDEKFATIKIGRGASFRG